MQFRIRVDTANAGFDLLQIVLSHEIGLVQDDHVGECDLVLGFGRVLQPVEEPLGVGDGDHRIEPCGLLHVGIDEEGLGHGCGVRQPRRLDDDRVELSPAFHQALDDADEIAAHGAADAAVVHFKNFFVGADDKIIVDADLPELVDDDGELPAVILGEDAVQERRLAGAEIAGQHGHGDFV